MTKDLIKKINSKIEVTKILVKISQTIWNYIKCLLSKLFMYQVDDIICAVYGGIKTYILPNLLHEMEINRVCINIIIII